MCSQNSTNVFQIDGDETEKEKLEKEQQRRMKKTLSSNIMRDLKQQFTDAPEEISVSEKC